MPELLLGPLLRYVDEEQATVWVQTDAPCEVEVLGRRARTFCIKGSHFGLVPIEDLEPGSSQAYEVRLDGELRWPEPGSELPPSLIRTIEPEEELRIAFGSCRVTVPHEPPYDLSKDDDDRGRGRDALRCYALRMLEQDPAEWPQLLCMIGDQVYADEVSPETLEFIRSRRDTSSRAVRAGRRLRGVHAPLPRGVVRAGRPLAALHGRQRRCCSTTTTSTTTGTSRSSGSRRCAPSRGGTTGSPGRSSPTGPTSTSATSRPRCWPRWTCCARRWPRDDAWPLLRDWAEEADRGSQGTALELLADPRAQPASCSWTPARAGCWASSRAGCSTRTSGTGSTSASSATSTTWSSPTRCRCSCRRRCTTSRRGTTRSATGPGAALAARLGEKVRQGLDLEHWGAFQHSFRQLTGLMAEVGAGRARCAAGDDRHARRRHPPRLRRRGRLPPRAAACARPSGRRSARPYRNPLDGRERARAKFGSTPAAEIDREADGEGGEGRGRRGPLAPGGGAELRQPDRHPDLRTAATPRCRLERATADGPQTLETSLEQQLS